MDYMHWERRIRWRRGFLIKHLISHGNKVDLDMGKSIDKPRSLITDQYIYIKNLYKLSILDFSDSLSSIVVK